MVHVTDIMYEAVRFFLEACLHIRTRDVSKQTICLFGLASSMAVAFLFNVELFPNPADFGQSRRGYGKVAESLEFGGWEEKHVSAQIKIGSKNLFQPKFKWRGKVGFSPNQNW